MISLGLFFGRKLQVGNIFFDGHVSESSSFPLQVTSNPVEQGANVVDNMVVSPFTLEVSAFISETPVFSLGLDGLFNQFKRTSDALDVLRQLQVSRQVVEVQCNLGYYENMAIMNIRPVSDLDNLTTIQINNATTINFCWRFRKSKPFR